LRGATPIHVLRSHPTARVFDSHGDTGYFCAVHLADNPAVKAPPFRDHRAVLMHPQRARDESMLHTALAFIRSRRRLRDEACATRLHSTEQ
jgi:hypothetical protein